MCRVTTIDLVTRFDACMIAFLDTELSTSDDDACIAFLNESNSCLSGRHVKRHCTAGIAWHTSSSGITLSSAWFMSVTSPDFGCQTVSGNPSSMHSSIKLNYSNSNTRKETTVTFLHSLFLYYKGCLRERPRSLKYLNWLLLSITGPRMSPVSLFFWSLTRSFEQRVICYAAAFRRSGSRFSGSLSVIEA